jgi:methyl-accepting chemotaxis protein
VGLVILFAAATLAIDAFISARLEAVVERHTQEVMTTNEKARIKSTAHAMALILGESLKSAQGDEKRRELARDIVTPLRFEEDSSGYFFVYQGTTNVALPPQPGLEGRDLADAVDSQGVHYVSELDRKAHAGGGYVDYVFPKPSGSESRKISYAEMIPGTDLWVGTGVYRDNVVREQARILGMLGGLVHQAMATSTAVFLVLVALLILFCLAIARSVAQPLAEATGAAERIASGDLTVRLDASGYDEAARLQTALNSMVAVLGQNIQEIKNRREEAEDKTRQAEQALEQARAAGREVVAQTALRIESLQKISSAVAHQLRNPTTIIGGLAGLLLKKPALLESHPEYLDGILDAARRIEHITTAVKEYSAIRLGQRVEIPAEDVLAPALEAGEAAARELGKTVVWEVGPGKAALFADKALLVMAVQAVTVNAVEALDQKGGRIRLSARPGEGSAEIAVTDDGRGIPEEELAYVYDPFYSTKSVGVGMGLTKAQRVLQEHGGTLSIETAQGRGTTVRLIVPAQAAATDSSGTAPDGYGPSTPGHAA